MKQKSDTNELAYTGGIIDGEGYIGIRRVKNKTKRGYALAVKVHVSNTNEWLIRWLYFQYGGSIYKHCWTGNRRDDWQWTLQTAQAVRFLKLVLPYLKIKQPQAEIAISFGGRRNQGYYRLSEEQIALDEAQRILISSYNRKGKQV